MLSIFQTFAPKSKQMARISCLHKRFFGSVKDISANANKMSNFMDQRTISFENGAQLTENQRTFSNEEMHRRLSNLQQNILNTNNLDFALFTSVHNVNYYSDFLYCSFNRGYGLIVPNIESETINLNQSCNVLITANIDGGQGYRRTGGYYGDSNIDPLLKFENIVYTDWQRDNYFYSIYESIYRNMNEDRLNIDSNTLRIGVEYDHMPIRRYNELKTFLELKLRDSNIKNIEFIDLSDDVMESRMIKSSEEHLLIENGAKIANIGGYAAIDLLRESVIDKGMKIKEIDVANASTNAMINAISAMYPNFELRDTWTWFQSGINCDGAHHPVTSKLIEKNDILSLNCFPMIAGYYTALERTLFYEDVPSKEHYKIWDANCKVYEKGLQLLVAGMKCSDIAKELNEIYLQYDLLKYRTFGYGHSFGVLSHYYGREAGLELREDCHTVLQPGMVVSMEPMVVIPEGVPGSGGYREHDIVIIQENGKPAKNITNFQVGPDRNIIC